MKIAVVGGIFSTQVVVEKLAEHDFTDVMVWGYSPPSVANISGWVNLEETAYNYGFRFSPFVKIAECENEIREYFPDILFVVGLSQIIPASTIDIPRLGAIGFHPTALPKGRGRAPIAWLILNEAKGAATFFKLRKGVDDGPILAQTFFDVTDTDNAKSLEEKIITAEKSALVVVLKNLKAGINVVNEQDHKNATWYGKRAPEDGWINWETSANDIAKLVRATSKPYPGAYSFAGNETVRIWCAQVIDRPIVGVVGRIVQVDNSGSGNFIIQCGKGLLNVLDWSSSGDWSPQVGARLGYYLELEVQLLRSYCRDLEFRLAKLEKLVN
jgi:methionyl-tRNA formyltransferase